MKQILIALVITLSIPAFGQGKAKTVKLKHLQSLMTSKSDSIQVVNFWATWCGPCVKELPIFEKLNSEYKGAMRVTLVSLDLDLDPNPEKVYKFVARKQLKSRVWLLDERDPNSWIDKVDTKWSGALPATIVINQANGKRIFHEGELTEAKLQQLIADIKK